MLFAASKTWHLVSQGGAVDGPPPRHRHSAVLHNNALWVFGGMTDLQERSDFWRFDFGKYDTHPKDIVVRGMMHLLFVLYIILSVCIYILKYFPFYHYFTVSRRWRPVKSKPGPGCLHSHCAVKFLSVMMLFGGEREGQTLNEMWRFHFGKYFY